MGSVIIFFAGAGAGILSFLFLLGVLEMGEW